jgi:hypothetical protein
MSNRHYITTTEIIKRFGRAVYDRMLSYKWHYTDDRGNAFWTEEDVERMLGLIAREDRERRQDEH